MPIKIPDALRPLWDFHPLSEIFPMMDDAAHAELVESIRANGQLEPVVMFEDMVLDGRNRAKACHELDINCETVELRKFYDGDPIKYVVAINQHRRHLTASQRAMVADKVAQLPPWRPETESAHGCALNAPQTTQAEAAEKLGVSRRSLQKARKVRESGDDATIEAVESGKMSVSAAAKKVLEVTGLSDETGPPTDALGIEIARSDVAECFEQAHLFGEIKSDVQRLQKRIKPLTESLAGAFLDRQQIAADLKNVWTAMKFGRPYTVCPLCINRKNAKCPGCKGAGWVPNPVYDRMTPEQKHEVPA